MEAFRSAQWIKVVEPELRPKGERPAYWIAKSFTSHGGAARIHISAQGIYKAYLNGTQIGDEELTPGSTQYLKRIQYQTFEISLSEGENKLEVLLADGWFRGATDIARSDLQFGEHVALIAEIHSADELVLATGADWLSSPSHILSADLFLGQNEDKNLVGFRNWSPVEEISVTAKLVPSIAPPVRKIETLAPVKVWKLEDGAYIADFGQNINGWTRLEKLGPKGNKTTLIHAEYLGPDRNINVEHLDVEIFGETIRDHQIDTVISAGITGDVFEPMFTTHGFQFVRVEGVSGELLLQDLSAVVVHTDLKRIGFFSTTEPRLTWLHDATVWSFRDNACDVPTDCPTRERAGWSGDWQIFVQTAAFLFDIDTFSRKWLADSVLDQRKDGRIISVSPGLKVSGEDTVLDRFQGSAGWGDVIVQAPLVAYWAYNKTEALSECFEAMQRWVDFGLRSAKNNRHQNRESPAKPHEEFIWDTGFHHGEWLEPGEEPHGPDADIPDHGEIATAYLYRSVRDLAQICLILGKPRSLATEYQRLAEKLKHAWQMEYLAADGLVKTKKQSAMARALEFELVPHSSKSAVAAELAQLVRSNSNMLTTGFLSTGYLLPALAENGQAATAFDLLFQEEQPSWLYMMKAGATTVWEYWDGISTDRVAKGSLNHYSKGSVISFLHQNVAGLKATSPGYETFVVEPYFDDRVPDASVRLDTPFGVISAGWRRQANDVVVEVSVQGEASGSVKLPGGRVLPVSKVESVSVII